LIPPYQFAVSVAIYPPCQLDESGIVLRVRLLIREWSTIPGKTLQEIAQSQAAIVLSLGTGGDKLAPQFDHNLMEAQQ
jgi:hypothetical protein